MTFFVTIEVAEDSQFEIFISLDIKIQPTFHKSDRHSANNFIETQQQKAAYNN